MTTTVPPRTGPCAGAGFGWGSGAGAGSGSGSLAGGGSSAGDVSGAGSGVGSGVGSAGCAELDGGSAEDGAGAVLDSGLVRPGTVMIGPGEGALLEVGALSGALLGSACPVAAAHDVTTQARATMTMAATSGERAGIPSLCHCEGRDRGRSARVDRSDGVAHYAGVYLVGAVLARVPDSDGGRPSAGCRECLQAASADRARRGESC